MGLVEKILEARQPAELAWPVGAGAVDLGDRYWGHDTSRYSPAEHGDYLVTSGDVHAAASLRARLMSGLDLLLYAGRSSDKQEVTSGRAAELLQRVNPYWTRRRLAYMDELSMCLWGQSYWVLEPDAAGVPTEIWWVKPTRMRPVPHEQEYLAGFLYEPLHGGPLIPFRPDEVVWFRYPNPLDEFSALSPLVANTLTADTAKAMLEANRRLFSHGLLAGGLVVPDGSKQVSFSKEQAQELEKLLETRFQGVDRAHRWSVLRYEAKMQALNVTPKDAEFANGLNLTFRKLCSAYGIPSPLLNDMEHATLSNAREYERLLWSHALVPDAWLKAEEIEEQYLPRFARRPGRPATPDHVEPDVSKVPALQESASESWARERQAIEVGALTVNEWRKSKGYPEVAWGDVWWAPVNKSAVSRASSQPQGDTAPAGEPVDAEQAAGTLATLELAQMELRHGPFALNGAPGGHGRNGHKGG